MFPRDESLGVQLATSSIPCVLPHCIFLLACSMRVGNRDKGMFDSHAFQVGMEFPLEFQAMVGLHDTWGTKPTYYSFVEPTCDRPTGPVCQEFGLEPLAKDANGHCQDLQNRPIRVFEPCDKLHGHSVERP